ncbi:YqzL family protein [Gorillibacterium sp. sgz500922]|uniref:YqzL family protein n=1 Tax=Gorillibacterium sp. sgz500922 TaxID=3446694 RepID=UPI003F66BAF5
MMKEFYWQYFHNTGNVDAYLLYKNDNESDDDRAEEIREEVSFSVSDPEPSY